MTDRVVVRAPATVANLGPGFDALGLALAWYDEVRVERADAGIEVTITGRGSGRTTNPDESGIVRAMRAVHPDLPPLRIHRLASVAFGRGFGASAIAIVSGLAAARALFDTPHSDDELLAIAVEHEGHPDNVAPCLLGGIAVSGGDRTIRLEPPVSMKVVVCVAPSRLSTETARGVLPESLTRADAVANAGRAALLAASLAAGRTDTLFDATDDVLHQPARFGLMPDTGDLVRALRAKGIAAFLSGAGPSVSALVAAQDAADAERIARAAAPDAWEVRTEDLDARGAVVVERR